MAFSTTRIETYPKKGMLKNVITLNDTAGNSDAMDLGDAVHITIQVEGTFASATVAVQASNDGVHFYALPTTAISFSASSGIKAVAELDRGFSKYMLVMSGGGASSALVCTIVSRIRQAGTP
jgi:hypothetical protein